MSTGLRAMRQSKGVSIREMEKLTGINRGRLSAIERGIPPTSDEIRLYVAVLSVDVPKEVAQG